MIAERNMIFADLRHMIYSTVPPAILGYIAVYSDCLWCQLILHIPAKYCLWQQKNVLPRRNIYKNTIKSLAPSFIISSRGVEWYGKFSHSSIWHAIHIRRQTHPSLYYLIHLFNICCVHFMAAGQKWKIIPIKWCSASHAVQQNWNIFICIIQYILVQSFRTIQNSRELFTKNTHREDKNAKHFSNL